MIVIRSTNLSAFISIIYVSISFPECPEGRYNDESGLNCIGTDAVFRFFFCEELKYS